MSISRLLLDVSRQYHDRLNHKAHAFLANRGITLLGINKFNLGYSSPDWHNLNLCHYEKKSVIESGMVVLSDKAKTGMFDRFRNRIMFPIRDVHGRVRGFGGRSINDDTLPKYLNSPESFFFQKRKILYGLYEGLESIKRLNEVIVVEGFFDVISLSQNGIENVVGTMGTACTSTQITKLFQYADKIVFCFDGDEAGKRAAVKVLSIVVPFLTGKKTAKFVFLPDNHDPDSFIRKLGVDAMQLELLRSVSIMKMIYQAVSAGCDCKICEHQVLILHRAKSFYDNLPLGRNRELLLRYCREATRLSIDELLSVWDA